MSQRRCLISQPRKSTAEDPTQHSQNTRKYLQGIALTSENMAAPPSIDIKNLDGKWSMNKSLSDPFDPVLALQGIGWLTRKGLGAATITQHLRQTPSTGEDGSPATDITIEQFVTGGIKGNVEKRVLDWAPRDHTDWLFGTVQTRNRYSTLAKAKEENNGQPDDVGFMIEGWLKETEEGEVVEGYAVNEKQGWTAWQIWGFADIGGERKLTRKFVVKKTGKDEFTRVRLTYDYLGPLE
ncbi:lccl domain-containing [Pyrenophora seminiperda CCB06]|uniref:Lccl domain-containing n=1 Tax=Pyrenophora seminiperda CCB06 TaxID=1302712 RepID=A0A3M7LWS2_9PLEO|nr:lccl domain-containing [Pyrenophora seminiperda CCB06]